MKPRLSTRRETAMTLFESLVVLAVVLLLGAIWLTGNQHARKPKPLGMVCLNNLKQMGLAYRIWAGDHGDRYPMGVSMTNGGSMELVQTGNVIDTFLLMSNELISPKILYCPADKDRSGIVNFNGLASTNISYFIGVDVINDLMPRQMISGDCNFELGSTLVKSGLQPFWTNDPVAWTSNRHGHNSGYIGLVDGSAQSTTLVNWHYSYDMQLTGSATNRFAIP